MKKTCAALAAAGFLAVMAGPALAAGGCDNWSTQSVSAEGDQQIVAGGEQSTPTTTTTQTASTEAASE